MIKLELPTHFNVDYPKKNIRYYTSYGKKKIAPLLIKSCNSYCMYCGKTVIVESDKRYNIEHSVDKDGNIHQEYDTYDFLKHCKYNLAIACEECNMVCKKVVDKLNFAEYVPFPKCKKKCDEPCKSYMALRNDYMKKNAIILQPLGVCLPIEYKINYNLLKHIFVPAYEGDYEEDDEKIRFFIQNHIDRFELNGRRFTSSVVDICVKIVTWYNNGTIEYDALMENLSMESFSNVLGALFWEYLQLEFDKQSVKKMVDFCELLVILDAVP